MTIFDDITRGDTAPPLQHETAFAYLNRSGRAEAARVRQLIDTWLETYPSDDHDALVARLRSPIDDHHRSAFFELFVYKLIMANGHKVVAIEPKLDHTSKVPDFLIEAADGGRLYMECVVATGRSHDEAAAQARLNQALAAIDRTPSPAHFLDLRVSGFPSAQISIKTMIRSLKAWINTLPDDDTTFQAAPFVYEEHGVSINLRAYPRHNRDRIGRAIGARFFPARLVTDEDGIRTALKRKASKYGPLDYPYMVAVNSFAFFAQESNTVDALLGTECVMVSHSPDGDYIQQAGRNPDGIWWGPYGPRKQGLGAVFSTEQVDPWNFAARKGRLIRNPWATMPLPAFGLGVDEYWPEDGHFRITDGAKFWTLLGLPEGWPEG